VDLSFPPGSSVNDGIPAKQYLGHPLHFTLPSHEAFESLIRRKGPGCQLYKRDLSRAYRQIPVDPYDYHMLGFTWRASFYFDAVFPFGLRSAAMACQRTTNAISYIHAAQGYDCVNYIDDFGGAETPDEAEQAFQSLGSTFQHLGLAESVEKATPPCTNMTFLGIGYDTLKMTKSVTQERLADTLLELDVWLGKKRATKQEIQVLLGKLAFVAICVQPGRVFLSRIITTLKGLRRQHHRTRLSSDFKKDVRWWRTFLPEFNGTSLIKDPSRRTLPDTPTTDACLTGCGGTFNRQYFH